MHDSDYGERLGGIEVTGRLLDEHLARYRFAASHLHGRSVLDVAAGTGWAIEILRSPGRLVVGVEIDDAAVRAAARRGMLVARADAQELPFADGSFEGCVSSETLEHVKDPARFVSELARILRPGGTLVLTTPNRESDAIPHNNPFHLHEFSAGELAQLLDPAFEIGIWAGQYPRASVLRQSMRRALAHLPIFRPVRMLVPPRYRAPFGRAAAGPASVVVLDDPVAAAPSTLAVVARRR